VLRRRAGGGLSGTINLRDVIAKGAVVGASPMHPDLRRVPYDRYGVDASRIKRLSHVRFCESLAVKPRPTWITKVPLVFGRTDWLKTFRAAMMLRPTPICETSPMQGGGGLILTHGAWQ
jgi:hypothetical protein